MQPRIYFAMLLEGKWIREYLPDAGQTEGKYHRGNWENRCNNTGESDGHLDFTCFFFPGLPTQVISPATFHTLEHTTYVHSLSFGDSFVSVG